MTGRKSSDGTKFDDTRVNSRSRAGPKRAWSSGESITRASTPSRDHGSWDSIASRARPPRVASRSSTAIVDAATGLLTHLFNLATEQEPRGFNIDPQGRYLLAAGRQSNRLTVYAIDHATGKLAALRQYPMSGDPNWIEIVALP